MCYHRNLDKYLDTFLTTDRRVNAKTVPVTIIFIVFVISGSTHDRCLQDKFADALMYTDGTSAESTEFNSSVSDPYQ